MKSKLLNLYSNVSIAVFVLSFVSLIALMLTSFFVYLNDQSGLYVEVQSTYVVDTKRDKLSQSGFNLGQHIEKDSFHSYYLKGKRTEDGIISGLESDSVVDLSITKEVYDNINSLGITKVIYNSPSNVEIYNEGYISYTDKFIRDYTVPLFVILLLSLANLYFIGLTTKF